MFALLYSSITKKKSIIETDKLRKCKKPFSVEARDNAVLNFAVGDIVQFTKNRKWQEAKIIYLSVAPTVTDEMKKLDIKLSVFTAKHMSTSAIDDLSEILKLHGKDTVFENLGLHRTKCSSIV
ncbi:hypothetical protein HCN44_009822 [Aphidius gifuensis]|uniref:Uncharacterized protein n=1 Tax=Aphidius gifuensis TaxID=684658 RepID=A0A834Y709_APHGI|nr:hypothetical protein HCN44_009822 [Aphidius gifuensis]